MKAIELYLSILEKAKTNTVKYSEETPSPDFDFEIEETDFSITNKQGFFMQKLITQDKASSVDNSIIFQSKEEKIFLIYPPHYIKINGYFTIRRTLITRIKKLNN